MKLSIVVLAVVALVALGQVNAEESRADVAKRIQPVGQVSVEGQVESVPVKAPVAESAPVVAAPAVAIAAVAASGVDAEAIYKKSCLMCHMTGAANAPILGNVAAWAPRIAKGNDVLVQSAINGIPGTAMQPRGTCATCSDDDLKAVVEYMIAKSK